MDSKSSLNMTAIATYNKNNITNKGKKAIENKDKENVNIEKIKNKQLNFINYLYYLITLHKNDNSFFQLYSDFRYKMISEENLILSNLNIDKLIQNNKRENSNNNDQQLDLTKRLNFNN